VGVSDGTRGGRGTAAGSRASTAVFEVERRIPVSDRAASKTAATAAQVTHSTPRSKGKRDLGSAG